MSGTAASSEALAGLVERVTFHNAENGFCVLRVKVRGQRDLVTVVGHAAMISAGEFVQMSERWFNDHTHGLQFKTEFLTASPPATLEDIERYFGCGEISDYSGADALLDLSVVTPRRLPSLSGSQPYRADVQQAEAVSPYRNLL